MSWKIFPVVAQSANALAHWRRVPLAAILMVVALPVAVTASSSPSNLYFSINASDLGSYDASTPAVWRDLSISQRNGTVFGSTGLVYNSTTRALEFPGGSNSQNSLGYVDMGPGFNNFGSGITIEFEGHFGSSNAGWERIFDFGNGAASDNIFVGVFGDDPDRLAIEIFIGNTSPAGRCVSPDGGLTPAGTFAKWVITLDGSKCRMFKNGLEVETARYSGVAFSVLDGPAFGVTYSASPANVNRTQNYIGRSNWGFDPAFDGAIKYVRIYTSALTPEQVANNAATYTLTYQDTGKDSGTAPAPQTGNGLLTLAANTGNLAKTGHSFGGWAMTSGQTTSIVGSYNLTTNSAVYPVWTPNTLNITYDVQNGTAASGGAATTTWGGTVSALPTTSRSGYTFDGWFTASSGGTQITTTSPHGQTGNFTLYAQWSAQSLPPFVVPPSSTTTTTTTTTSPPSTTTTPPRPVLIDDERPPSFQPGEGQATENGAAVPTRILVENDRNLVMTGPDFRLQISGDCQVRCAVVDPASGRPTIQLDANGQIFVEGTGFQPGTMADVWIFSTPTYLGSVEVSADGTFTGRFPLGSVAPGDHVVQVNGTTADGATRSANLGVVVRANVALPVTGDAAWIVVVYLALLLSLIGAIFWLRSRPLVQPESGA